MDGVNDRTVIIDAPATTTTRLAVAAAQEGITLVQRSEEQTDGKVWIQDSGAAAVIIAEPNSLSQICDWTSEVGARLVVITRSGPLRRDAQRRGIAVVSSDADWPDVVGALAASLGGHTAHTPTSGTVSVVWGPIGAPGRSSIASALAAEFASAGRTVVLIDADTYGSAQAASLGILDESAGIAAACRAAVRGDLTVNSVDRYVHRFDGADGHGFWLLSGLARAARWPEVDEDSFGQVIQVCSQWADDVIVDVGFNLEQDEEIASDMMAPHRNAATLAALRHAAVVVAVAGAEPVNIMRYVRAHADLVELSGAARIVPVVNRVRWNALGAHPHGQVSDALERFTGISDPAIVPFDQRAIDRAFAEQGTWRDASPRSPLVHAIRRLAERIDPRLRADSRPDHRRGRGSPTGRWGQRHGHGGI
ncbi:MAG: AAA family ATPase [Mycetocola sp.]